MTLAILCSGQGAQHAGMFALTRDTPAAKPLFAVAAALLGYDPGDASLAAQNLLRNRDAQVLCTLAPLCVVAALGNALPARRCVAGYSVGEIAAWSVAGLIEPGAALELVAARARAMDAASQGDEGMLFVRGLARELVDAMCAGRAAEIAIVNPGEAFVLAGQRDALDAIAIEARQRGAARVVPVAVQVASHTRFLAAASPVFRERLAQARIARALRPGVRLFSGIDGATVLDIGVGLDKLGAQISQPVQWAACIDACVESGVTAFLELGPGRALAEMAAAAYPSLPSRSVEDFKSLHGVRDWLVRIDA